MESNELRIGNYILVNRLGIDIVAKIESGKEIDNCEICQYKQILITEEWLLRFGFERREDKMLLISGYFFIVIDDYKGCLIMGRHIPIKYVHQLQNLHFVLTGEELTLKT